MISNAALNPWTMMVHLHDTHAAPLTMVASWKPQHITFGTMLFVDKFYFLWAFDEHSRVLFLASRLHSPGEIIVDNNLEKHCQGIAYEEDICEWNCR
jgi:hypothetical protein